MLCSQSEARLFCKYYVIFFWIYEITSQKDLTLNLVHIFYLNLFLVLDFRKFSLYIYD